MSHLQVSVDPNFGHLGRKSSLFRCRVLARGGGIHQTPPKNRGREAARAFSGSYCGLVLTEGTARR